MNRETIKAFISWLESASDAEIQEHRKAILEGFTGVSSREGRRDFNLALRLLDEEVIARIQAKALRK